MEVKKDSFFNWENIQRVGGVIAIVASIATLVGLWFQFRDNNPVAEFQVQSSELITAPSGISDLTSIFVYKGDTVKTLHKLKCRFVNSGNVTLIGKGPQQNVFDEIQIEFDPGLVLLEKSAVIGESNFPSSLVISNSNRLEFRFAQWKPGEFATYTLFVKSSKSESVLSLPAIIERPIIDGEFLVSDFSSIPEPRPKPLIDRWFPKPIALIIRIFGGLILVIVSFVAIAILVGMFQETRKYSVWKRGNIDMLDEYLTTDTMKGISVSKEVVLESPERHFTAWAKAGISRPPTGSRFESIKEGIGQSFLFVLVFLGGIMSIFALIVW